MPIMAGRVSDDALQRIVAAACDQPFAYDEVGCTRDGMADPPPVGSGYHVDRYERRLGDGDDGDDRPSFDRAVDGLRTWQAHRGAGVRVTPADAPLEVGTTVVVSLPIAPMMTMVAPCRVVYVTDEPGERFGFAYGTLPGHPERGEEAFHVVRDPRSGELRFEIVAFSRPVHPLARAGGPVARRIQRLVTHRYLDALAAYVRQ